MSKIKKVLSLLLVVAVFVTSVSSVVIGTNAAESKQTLNI